MANQISETMSREYCQTFRISQFSWIDLHSNILKLCENGEEFWNGVFCMLPPGALSVWCMNPALLKYTLRKKKCNFPTFLRDEFSLLYMYSNFWVLQGNCAQFWKGFFAHCHQKDRQNEICYKVHLSALFHKRHTTFHGAFLLRLSVVVVSFQKWLLDKNVAYQYLYINFWRQFP